eukprot:3884860-Pyramimonas_sp.AAC.1
MAPAELEAFWPPPRKHKRARTRADGGRPPLDDVDEDVALAIEDGLDEGEDAHGAWAAAGGGPAGDTIHCPGGDDSAAAALEELQDLFDDWDVAHPPGGGRADGDGEGVGVGGEGIHIEGGG